MGSTKPLVTFEVLSTHKGWSLSKASGLRTYSVQSQGLLQRKVKPHRPVSGALGGENCSSVDAFCHLYRVDLIVFMQFSLEKKEKSLNNWRQQMPDGSEHQEINIPEDFRLNGPKIWTKDEKSYVHNVLQKQRFYAHWRHL